MKKSKFTESQIVFALHQAETGTKMAEVYRKMGISEGTFYNWKKKFGGLGTSELRRLHQLKEENPQLKKLIADLSLGQYRVSERRVARVTMLARVLAYPHARVLAVNHKRVYRIYKLEGLNLWSKCPRRNRDEYFSCIIITVNIKRYNLLLGELSYLEEYRMCH